MKKINIAFAGTPEFSAYHLEQLVSNNLAPSLVLTQPDRKSGRGKKVQASPVKQVAQTHNLSVFQPEKLNDQAKKTLLSLPQPDLLIVVAYGLLLPQWALDWAKYGAINVHASLLPRWRGAAPIQRAIEAGDKKTGIGIMQMDIGLDTGDIWAEIETPITEKTTAQSLHDELKILGAKALIDNISFILAQNNVPKKQAEEGVTYAKKLNKEEAQINWEESAEVICRKIRAFNPYPVAFSTTNTNKTIRIFNAAPHTEISANAPSQFSPGQIIKEDKAGIIVTCGNGAICITELQEKGKKRLFVDQFINGNSLLNQKFI